MEIELKQIQIEKIIPKYELSNEEKDRLIFEGDKDDRTSK